jgi:hypothetical protein
MESVYHIVAIRVNETSWAHVWRLRSRYLETGYDIQNIGWGKLYDELCLCSRILTLEFLMTFETVEQNRKSFVKSCLFGK